MKAYRSVHGHMNLFRPELNLQRLNASAIRVGLPEIDPEILLKGIERLVSIDNEWLPISAPLSLYIRPNLIGTEVSNSITDIKNFQFLLFNKLLIKKSYYELKFYCFLFQIYSCLKFLSDVFAPKRLEKIHDVYYIN